MLLTKNVIQSVTVDRKSESATSESKRGFPMKLFFFSVLFLSFLTSCQPEPAGEAAKVSEQVLEAAAREKCAANEKFQVFTEERKLAVDSLPHPVLFAIQQGTSRCADFKSTDHGGLASWLDVSTSLQCVLNGSVWVTESFSSYDGNKVDFNLKPYSTEETGWIHIYTNRGYSLNELRSRAGLVVYQCVVTP
jgi:hypothetical protein